jgi:hypothetical protein
MKKIGLKILIFLLSLLPGYIVHKLIKKDNNDSWLL